jgi:hypothetical protein
LKLAKRPDPNRPEMELALTSTAKQVQKGKVTLTL